MRIKLGPWDWLALGMIAMQGAASLYVSRRGLEGVLPIIFDTHGEVWRWGDRQDVAFLLGVTAVVTLVLHLALNGVAYWTRGRALDARVIPVLRMVAFVTVDIIAALLAAIGLGGFYWTGAPQA